MPCSYVIDTGKRLVITTACGCVTFAEIRAHQDKLLSDPEFNPELQPTYRCDSRDGAGHFR